MLRWISELPAYTVPARALSRNTLVHDAVVLGAEQDGIRCGFLAPLVREEGHRDRPTVTDLTDDVVRRGPGAVEEHLAELTLVVQHLDRPHFDAGLLHGAQQERDPAMATRVGIGAGEQEDPRRVSCE